MSLQPGDQAVEQGRCSEDCSLDSAANPATLDLGPRMLRHFSHRCRNSLSGIKLGLYLLKKEPEGLDHAHWHDLGRTYSEIEKLFDRLQRICQSTSLTLVRSPLGQLFAERLPLWRSRYPDWGRTIVLDPPEQDVAGDFDPSHLGLGLDAFVTWRAESSDSPNQRIAWRTTGGQFEISWQESSECGGNQDRRSNDFPPGCQPADCTGSLAVLLLARVAADHGGELEARREPALSVTIRWPQFRDERLSRPFVDG
jgi:hypothetical protein